MRILHVTDTFLPRIGGAEIAIDQLVRAMTGLGIECAVLAQWVQGEQAEIQTPYPLFRFSNPRSATWAGWWIARHIMRARKNWGHFDAIIAHHAFPPGYAVVKCAGRLKIPCIVYPRGGDVYEVSRFRKKPLAWRKLRWTLKNAPAVICASQAMEEVVRKITPRPLVRIGNGVNIEELRQDASHSRFAGDASLAQPFVLALGRTIRRKGFDLLIDAVATGTLPEHWKLVIAGDGRELNALKNQAQPLGAHIVFTGLVQGDDKRWLLQNCQFLACPSREESFGNVALEAMACGKPVLASRASGFAEIVQDGQNGRLVGIDQPDELAAAMHQLTSCDLPPLAAAAQITAKNFAWPSIAQKYRDLLTSLCPVPRS